MVFCGYGDGGDNLWGSVMLVYGPNMLNYGLMLLALPVVWTSMLKILGRGWGHL